MPKEKRVRYIGPERSGVPFGRVGTLLESESSGFCSVKWDLYPNCDCQVTHSCCSTTDLEEVCTIPRCDRPTRAGTYVIEYKGTKELAFVRRDDQDFNIRWGISSTRLSKIDDSAIWWGPVDIQ